MAIDFREQAEQLARQQKVPTPVPGSTESVADPTARSFGMTWWGLLVAILAIGFMLVSIGMAMVGPNDGRQAATVVIRGIGLLFLLGWLPNSLCIDREGVHQVHFLGLWRRTIPANDVRSFRRATRGELRKEGAFRWQPRWAWRQRGDGEEVVWVGSKTSNRHILHTSFHRDRAGFMKELHDRGYALHGYEGWEQFMEDRGVPVR